MSLKRLDSRAICLRSLLSLNVVSDGCGSRWVLCDGIGDGDVLGWDGMWFGEP